MLGGVTIDTDAIPILSQFPKLIELNLARRPLSDDDIAALATSPALDTLLLKGGKLTDASIEHLKRFPKLTMLVIAGRDKNSPWAKKLEEALPNCKFKWE